MTQQKDELSKELCGLLGICWHIEAPKESYLGQDGKYYMTCLVCGETKIDRFGFYFNPDFTSEAGRVQLLKLILSRVDWPRIANHIGYWKNTTTWYIHPSYMLDDNGAFAIAARDLLKKESAAWAYTS
jgi:hypothetical protein